MAGQFHDNNQLAARRESRMAAPATQRASELGNRPGKASCGLRPGFEHAGPYQISFPLRPPCRAASCAAVSYSCYYLLTGWLVVVDSFFGRRRNLHKRRRQGKATFLFGQPTGSHSPVRPRRLLLFLLLLFAGLEASFFHPVATQGQTLCFARCKDGVRVALDCCYLGCLVRDITTAPVPPAAPPGHSPPWPALLMGVLLGG